MNAFDLSSQIEKMGLAALEPFLEQSSYRGRFVTTHKGPLAQMFQESIGDIVMMDPDSRQMVSIELKVEESDKHNNFYLETWSNKNYNPRNVGWIYKILADVVWYYFLNDDRLYVINNKKLFHWAHEAPSTTVRNGLGRMYDFPERRQSKYEQRNKGWGRCVPIDVIGAEVGWELYMPKTRGLELVGRMP